VPDTTEIAKKMLPSFGSLPDVYRGAFLGSSTTLVIVLALNILWSKKLEISFKPKIGSKSNKEAGTSGGAKDDEDESSGAEDTSDEEEEQTEGLSADARDVPPTDWDVTHAPFKMLLCVNQQLFNEAGKPTKMTAGKTSAQCSHATLGAYKRGMRRSPGAVKAWEYTGQAKIAVKCPTEAELHSLRDAAAQRGVNFYLVQDAGHTQIAPGSKTVLALGPAPVSVFDDFTGHLKLY
jgi:peptidyl-tRNA hydrolase